MLKTATENDAFFILKGKKNRNDDTEIQNNMID